MIGLSSSKLYTIHFCLDYLLPHPIWSEEEVETVRIKHKQPEGFVDKLAYYTVQTLRKTFDFASGYTINTKLETLDERSCLIRCIFLETVAGEINETFPKSIEQTNRLMGAIPDPYSKLLCKFICRCARIHSRNGKASAFPSPNAKRPWLDSHIARRS